MTSNRVTPITAERARRTRSTQFGLAGLVFAALASLLSTQCDNEQCEELRENLYREKISWQSCERSSDCIIVGGNEGDCTGVFSCNVAVNTSSRVAAERRIASLPELTVDCHQCGSPNCPDGEIAICEEDSRLCFIVSEVLDEPAPGLLKTVEGNAAVPASPVPGPTEDAAPPGVPSAAATESDAAADAIPVPFL